MDPQEADDSDSLVQTESQVQDAPTNFAQVSNSNSLNTGVESQLDVAALEGMSAEQLQAMQENLDQMSLNDASVGEAADIVTTEANDENLSISDLKVKAMEMAKDTGKKGLKDV